MDATVVSPVPGGWRMSFYVFAVAGLTWYAWFRDSPEEKRGSAPAAPTSSPATRASAMSHAFPWRPASRSRTVWSMLGLAFWYVYVYNFFQTWFHAFLVRGRGFSEANLFLSALPFVVAAGANLAGGGARNALVRCPGRNADGESLAPPPSQPRRRSQWRRCSRMAGVLAFQRLTGASTGPPSGSRWGHHP